ncbi:ADP-ribose glycohydrolase MACROD1-like isoform X4, partial [Huso huso]
QIDRVIFCIFLETDYKIYKEKLSKFFSQDNDMNEDAAEGMTQEEGLFHHLYLFFYFAVKKYTPPSKKSKKKKLNKDEDSNEAEEDNDKTESADAEMESQKEEADKPDNTDAEMESQNLDAEDNPASEEPREGRDRNNKESASDVNTKQEKPTKGQKHGDDPMEDRAETEESKTGLDKDEVGCQLTGMETEAAVCQNKDPNLDSKELSRGGSKPEDELMEDQGVAGDVKDP